MIRDRDSKGRITHAGIFPEVTIEAPPPPPPPPRRKQVFKDSGVFIYVIKVKNIIENGKPKIVMIGADSLIDMPMDSPMRKALYDAVAERFEAYDLDIDTDMCELMSTYDASTGHRVYYDQEDYGL